MFKNNKYRHQNNVKCYHSTAVFSTFEHISQIVLVFAAGFEQLMSGFGKLKWEFIVMEITTERCSLK